MDILEVLRRFPSQESCLRYLEQARWGDRPACPYCGSLHTAKRRDWRHRCYDCNVSFSVTVGTIFHHTHLPLQKWFMAIFLMMSARKGLSGLQLARTIGVNKDTAWRISMKIREAMTHAEEKRVLSGIVEMDETYVGGKPRRGDGKPHKRGRGTLKTPVVGAVERRGSVSAYVAKKGQLGRWHMEKFVKERVRMDGSRLMTDEYRGYSRMSRLLPHSVIPHWKHYVDGDIHTNTIESFWAVLKRQVAQYHHVSNRHLQKYVDEACYRYNLRHVSTREAFETTIRHGLSVGLA